MLKKVLIISNFPKNEDSINGQSLKALTINESFLKNGYKTKIINYYNYKRRPFSTFLSFLFGVLNNKLIIVLPDKGALSFITKFLTLNIFRKKKIFYSVVGGWLPSFLEGKKSLIKKLTHYKGIWVENQDMKDNLNKHGILNVSVVENYKCYDNNIRVCSRKEFQSKIGKFCIFSRLDPDKGIREAIEAISLCKKKGLNVSLDIYGPIKQSFSSEFNELLEVNKGYIFYKGIGKPNTANEIVSNYYMQFFLTKLSTEGIPGSIIDSFAGAVPILFFNWNDKFNMIQDCVTGFAVKNLSIEHISSVIEKSLNEIELVYNMKANCLKSYNLYNDTIFNKILLEIEK